MDLCADSLFELCQKVYDMTVAKYGHFILYQMYYWTQNETKNILQDTMATQIKAFTQKYTQTLKQLQIEPNKFLPHVFLTITHIVRYASSSEVLLTLVDTATQLFNEFSQFD